MNFLLRTTQAADRAQQVQESHAGVRNAPKTTPALDVPIAEIPYTEYPPAVEYDGEADEAGGENDILAAKSAKHSDVSEEEGCIAIPYKELPENWNDASNIKSLRSLDRSFVFPGEQLHILACLSACKQDAEIITPFKLAAMMNKSGTGHSYPSNQKGDVEDGKNSSSGEGEGKSDSENADQNGEDQPREKIDPKKELSESETLLRMEDFKRQTETLLQRFKNSHFFVRIAESGQALWSKRSSYETFSESSKTDYQKLEGMSRFNADIDRGNFDANALGGVARNKVQCCALSNGDMVVLLQVNVGVDFLRDPVIEILQFEKYPDKNLSTKKQDNIFYSNQDPCGELLKWLLPLEYAHALPPRSSSPPSGAASGIAGTPQNSTPATSSGSQIFSFGSFRSYSMSSLNQNPSLLAQSVKALTSKLKFDLEDWDHFSTKKFAKGLKSGLGGLLSFRGVSLEQERFSVSCGLEGIYIPGKRWRRKVEIIQPVKIHSFSAHCNTTDLLCVQIKNISPAHTPDVVIYIDAITIVSEEASKGGRASSLPIACVEAGNDHSLPNLALRRGEEHSFILKPSTSTPKNFKNHCQKSPQPPQSQTGNAASPLDLPSNTLEEIVTAATTDQYAIMVSCRCNYTESRLFFKQPTSWRPRGASDLMVSVASAMSRPCPGASGRVSQLPVQILTLQASNLTSEDLTLTVLAPASFTSPPTVVSLNSAPSTPVSPFADFSEFTEKRSERRASSIQRLTSAPAVLEKNQKQNVDGIDESISPKEQHVRTSDAMPNAGFGCTHLWLHSRVPLGLVPSQSTVTMKLELLPLTDGIITLDTLQFDVKEKGRTYIAESSLMINAISSISTGIPIK